MLLWGVWALLALGHPASSSGELLGLALVAVVLLVAATAAGLPVLAPPPAGSPALPRRTRTRRLPRLLDPDAAGRPRPRAPTSCPEAA